ncbi:MAG: family 2 glycosyl transferase [Bacteroidetes bacterium]|nr:MAG: family 2 glycosyl transferase [Bacteroidota bacterium]
MADAFSIQKRKHDNREEAVFSILIPTWNNLPYLKLCIQSIKRNSKFHHQLIVHVNEGNDGTLEWIQSQPDIDFTASKTNIGVCYALNICSALATTDYIVYLNDDMYLCPGWDEALLDEIKGLGHNAFFFSCTPVEPAETGNACVIVKDFGRDIESFREEKLLKEYAGLEKSDWSGSTWPPNIVHKDYWNLVGGYSTEFSPGMYSDPDFSMKLWKAGVRLFKGVSKSRAYHFGSKSVGRVVKNKGYQTFVAKWGMTSGTFTRIFLKSGASFAGPLTEPEIPALVRWKNRFKKLQLGLKRPA